MKYHKLQARTLSPEKRHKFRPLEFLADEELAIIGMLAPLFRENARKPLHALSVLAGLEENRRSHERAEAKQWLHTFLSDTGTDSPHGNPNYQSRTNEPRDD